MGRTVMRYSEAFKLKVVNEIETGKLSGVRNARMRYGINGGATVQNWLREYGKNHLLSKVIKVQNLEERDELKMLKRRVRELEEIVSDKCVDLKLETTFLKIACEAAGYNDMESFKKKHNSILSTELQKAVEEQK